VEPIADTEQKEYL